jgi:hypothetical protein
MSAPATSVVSQLLGGMDVLIRYASADSPVIEGDPRLCRYGEDSRVDELPVFELRQGRRLRAVA